jgi:hypothetical protein
VRRLFLHRLSAATVILLIPLFFALGGTAAAAPSLQVSHSANASPLPASSHSWKIVRSANRTGTVNYLDAVACSSSARCEAVGYRQTGGALLPLAEVWNGTRWALQAMPNPTGSTDTLLIGVACPSATRCEAVGYYNTSSTVQVPLAEGWNGTTWAVQTTPSPASATQIELQAVACPKVTRCEAVGSYNNSSGGFSTLAERWNGTTWAVRATPNPGATQSALQAVACPTATECEAAGYQNNSSGVFVPLAEDWNGTTWAVQTTPSPGGPNSELYGEACSSVTSCEAVGYYVPGSQGGALMFAERWNGTTWALQTTPGPPGATISALYGVACPPSTPDCEAIGAYSGSSGVSMTLAERWNGTRWHVQTTPNPAGVLDSYLNAVACLSATDCEAIGDDITSSTATVTLAERWS